MFHPDGTHLLGGGSEDGIRRWQLSDGQEVGRQTGMTVYAISVSRDQKWIVCGTAEGAMVWDGEMHEKVIVVEDTRTVYAVDVSPDSTKFATGSGNTASIWSITSGKRLVGPLKHNEKISGIPFSPTGERFATACYTASIYVFDSQTGDKLVTINTTILRKVPATPLAWSSDAQQIFVASDHKIRSFKISTGSLLAESQVLHDGTNYVYSIALATNNKFIAASGDRSISFLDTSTLTRIGPDIEDGERVASIAISADSSHLVTGRGDGKFVIRDLSKILPDLYGPFNVSIWVFIISAIPISSPAVINYIAIYSKASTTRRAIFDIGRSRQQDS